jgi:hypothetical protein
LFFHEIIFTNNNLSLIFRNTFYFITHFLHIFKAVSASAPVFIGNTLSKPKYLVTYSSKLPIDRYEKHEVNVNVCACFIIAPTIFG